MTSGHGPQLNNYRDLMPLIKDADETEAEPLTDHEERIIGLIVKAFPGDLKIYGAAHKEQAYTSKKHGELVPYTDAESITAV